MNQKERQPLIDLEGLAARAAAPTTATPSTDLRSVDAGRSGAGRDEDGDTPRITGQVDGLA